MYREDVVDEMTSDVAVAANGAQEVREITETYDEQIADLVEDIRAYQARMALLQEKIDDAKTTLRDYLEKRGENWKDDEGYARIVSEGIRSFYRTKDLDRLIAENPEDYNYLSRFRSESIVRSSVQVK